MRKKILAVVLSLCLLAPNAHAGFADGGAFGSTVNYLKRVGTHVLPSVTATYNLGSPSKTWNTIYAASQTVTTFIVTGSFDWSGGNVVYVPLTGSIEAYHDAATAGDTLVLASGNYVVTDDIDITKAINIVGQGVGKTTIACATASKNVFDISASNVRISDFSISSTGATAIAINTANNLSGLVFENLDITCDASGVVTPIYILGSNAILRDITIAGMSSNGAVYGVFTQNTSATTQDATIEAYNVEVVVDGATNSSYAFLHNNNNDANTITLKAYNCYGKSLAAGAADTGLGATSTTTSNAVALCYGCTFDGQDNDVLQNNANTLTLYNCTLVNGTTSGTITYGGTVVSSKVHADGVTTSTNFKKCMTVGGLTIWISDGTTAEGALTGVEGDICLNGGTGAGQAAYCDANGTNWTDM